MKFLLLLLLPLYTYAAQILSYNIYDRTERVDVMITFDTPYHGSIKQSYKNSKIIIKLEDAEIESSKIKRLSSKFLTYLSITPMIGYTQIVASVPSSVYFKASQTTDSYGLRLRFTKKTSSKVIQPHYKMQQQQEDVQQTGFNALPTKKDSTELSTSYYVVVGILILGIIILFILKKKIMQKNQQGTENSWLFQNTKSQQIPTQKTAEFSNENLSIKFQKKFDERNTIVMIDFQEQSYLVLMGANNNLLLDKFVDNRPTSQEGFEELLQTKHQELDELLKVNYQAPKEDSQQKEPLQAFQEKAASLSYTQSDSFHS